MRIKIRPSFIAYLGCIIILSSVKTGLCVLLALLVHEAGHLIAGRLSGEKIDQLEITPFGGIMTCKWGNTFQKGIRGLCVHAAGPLMNYAMILLSGTPSLRALLPNDVLHAFITANAAMFMLNLFPALPLDGGSALFCIGYYLFPVASLVSILSTLGMITGVCLLLLAAYGFSVYGIINCSLLIVGIYLFVSARHSRSVLLAENIYAIVQERLGNACEIRPIHFYSILAQTRLFSLVPILQNNHDIRLCFTYDKKTYTLNEETLCRMLLLTPALTVSEAYFSLLENKEKSRQNRFSP